MVYVGSSVSLKPESNKSEQGTIECVNNSHISLVYIAHCNYISVWHAAQGSV